MHIHLAFRFSKGRTEEMGTCQAPHYGGVAACACASVRMFIAESHFSPFKWSSLFSSPSLHLCSYHSNTNGSSTAERSCALSHSLNIHLTERRRGWQSASLAGRRLTGFLSVWLTDWLVIWGRAGSSPARERIKWLVDVLARRPAQRLTGLLTRGRISWVSDWLVVGVTVTPTACSVAGRVAAGRAVDFSCTRQRNCHKRTLFI